MTKLDILRQDGLVSLGQVLSAEECEDIRAALHGLPAYDGHVPGHGSDVKKPIDGKQFFASYDLETNVKLPHLFAMFTSPAFVNFAKQYLGYDPILYSVNTYWTFPAKVGSKYTAFNHRDVRDVGCLAIFIYLTDVLVPGDGEHVFQDMPLFAKAGTVFLEDPNRIHRGEVPRSKPRLMSWARYGRIPEPGYVYLHDATKVKHPLEDTPEMRYLTQTLIDWGTP